MCKCAVNAHSVEVRYLALVKYTVYVLTLITIEARA